MIVIKILILIVMVLLLRKAVYVWRRALATFRRDRQEHSTLCEYLLGNGAKEWETYLPFLRHAAVRAFQPLLGQWKQLLALVAVLVILVLIQLMI